ncbi:unnamed protein product [Blepharisma stoltei]|uniref:Ribosomal protein eL8/eL30/eS12/Gadd45 domain-containing protein n=1 Tax=Blepharisma stoltei TaxID=1481888 RepID=A0AAU9JWB4_9CILI|nr:unnamed protein product [Blepharisma stoltei]
MSYGFNLDAPEFIPFSPSTPLNIQKPKNAKQEALQELKERKADKTAKKTGFQLSEIVLEHIILSDPPKVANKNLKDKYLPISAAPSNPMVKARIIVDGQAVTARIPKKDLHSGCYKVVPKKPSKLKSIIKENRKEEGKDESRRPKNFFCREYVNQILTHELDNRLEELLSTLIAFYNKKKEKNARVKKKIVKGLKECNRSVMKNKAKLVIIAPNIEKVPGEGGLDELVNELIENCQRYNVPYLFGLDMVIMGRIIINNAVTLTAVGIIDFIGGEQCFSRTLELGNLCKQNFNGIAYDYSTYYNVSS